MHTRFVAICTVALLLNMPAVAQEKNKNKLSWYYPKLETINGRVTGMFSFWYNLSVSGCVSGDCKNGTGVFVRAINHQPVKDTLSSALVHINVYKGKFSKDGVLPVFEGTYYSRTVPYKVVKDEATLERDGAKFKMVPDLEWNFKEESSLAPYEIGNGRMIYEENGAIGFGWAGPMKFVNNKSGKGEVSSFEALFGRTGNKLEYADIQFTPGGKYLRMKGRFNNNDDMVGGRLEFADGGVYEGFLCSGKFFGPGRYKANDGKISEGIWMLDSLAMPMTVHLPKALFEKVDKTDFESAQFAPGGISTKYRHYPLYDAGGGWVFTNATFFLGKVENGEFTGPGVSIDRGEYYTGIFKNGMLTEGMRVKHLYDESEKKPQFTNTGIVPYQKSGSHVITGSFKDNMLVRGCGRKLYYDRNDKLTKIIEGVFYPSRVFNEERPYGWVYVNDWTGNRDVSTLRYYNNGDLNDKTDEAEFMLAYKEALKDKEYCFGTMKSQADITLVPFTQRASEIAKRNEAKLNQAKEEKEKNERYWNSPEMKAFLAKQEEARQKAAQECAALQKARPLTQGMLFKLANKDGHAQHALITGGYDCKRKAFPVILQYWTSTVKNKGYMSISSSFLNPQLLLEQIPGNFSICAFCAGKGYTFAKVVNEVGGNSGYTSLGNGWAVKNPETYWVSEVQASCSKCNSRGFN